MKDWAKAFYKSAAWQACRASYIDTVHGMCERHLKRGQYVPGYIVHHKIELTPQNINDPMISLNHEHLEYVCLDCHNDEHLHKKDDKPLRYRFAEDGRVVQALPPSEK
jgi:5-methylcytosine-specific restriction enzyme A